MAEKRQRTRFTLANSQSVYARSQIMRRAIVRLPREKWPSPIHLVGPPLTRNNGRSRCRLVLQLKRALHKFHAVLRNCAQGPSIVRNRRYE